MSDFTVYPDDRRTHKRPCDFCGESIAVLYCRADSAKLCFSCDREVHSTNQFFTKHARSLLCDSCDSSSASIFCSTDASVFCQNCDWEWHNERCRSAIHDRWALKGFNGCPSVTEILGIVGFEDVDKKYLFGDGVESFSNFLVWDTPPFLSLDDLIVSSVRPWPLLITETTSNWDFFSLSLYLRRESVR